MGLQTAQRSAYFGNGSLADIKVRIRNVRFTPETGHFSQVDQRPLVPKADILPVHTGRGESTATLRCLSNGHWNPIRFCVRLCLTAALPLVSRSALRTLAPYKESAVAGAKQKIDRVLAP